MRIPKIKLEKAVVQGTGVADLKKGPGHYTQTPLPGEKGNVGIAGHRTTYGAPFADIGELNTGDDIFITTRQGTFNYKVTVKNIVSPETVSVLDPSKDDRLTLTTCHPKLSAKQRLIVTALLQGPAAIPSPKPAETATPSSPDSAKSTETLGDVSLSGEKADITPALIWGAICIGWIVLMWSMTSFLNRWIIWIFGTPIFLVFLFFFFENFARLLPANA